MPVPVRVRLCVVLGILPVLAFTAACLVYNAPQSPASVRLAATARKVLEPYFWQDWQLFGPTPGTSNNLVYLQARIQYRGKVVETAPVEVEEAIDRAPRGFRINPTKLPGIMLAFDQTSSHYASAATRIRKLPAAQQKSAQAELDKRYQADFREMQRFFSARAHSLYPGARILAVQATFKTRPMIPFSERYEHPRPAEQAKGLLRTSWMAYVPGVAQ
ncbi:DUF5819 family protein [Streptomyces sp. NBC_00989]|uniref:DUF5819 family protein n=1 Tax=Streptomyces sp. NBC_00989 TaxID=2903705 RepID=UPI00386FF308|nr:DUF5819 family protein [Streptomyces sp. NBC_00989]